MLWQGGEFHCVSYSAHFFKGEGQKQRSLLWVRAHPIQVTTLCDSLCPGEGPREQKKKENIPVLQDTDWDKGAMKVGMCVCVCTHMCVLPQEGKPTEEKIQEAKNALKGLASREK